MKSVVLPALLGMTLWLGLPASASAQEPEPAPAPAPQAPPPPPRDVAVPRSERVPPREGPARAPETRSRESGASEGRERQSQPSDNRVPERVRETDTHNQRRQRIGAASTAAVDDSSDEQGAQRRGASRRPPSSPAAGSAQARDRGVPRSTARRQEPTRVYVYPDYWSYNRYSNRYYNDPYDGAFGLGYLQYSPWGWTPAFYGDPYAYAYGGGYSGAGYSPRGEDVGSVKLKVNQPDAEVFVDGYFAGYVDDFDGFLQALKLDSGAHRVEIRKPGYETLHFDVRVRPNRNTTFRGEMRPVL